MVVSGTVTAAQTRELMVDVVTGITRMVESRAAADLTKTLRMAHPQKGTITRDEAETRFTGQLIEAGGIGFFARGKRNYQVVLHWPSIFKEGLTHPRAVQTRMVWAFQALVRRRSPLLFSLLRRKLITENAMFDLGDDKADGEFQEEALKAVIPVNYDEMVLYEGLVNQFSQIPDLGRVAGKALARTLESVGLPMRNQYNVLSAWKHVLPPIPKGPSLFHASTLVPRAKLALFREILQAGKEISPPDIVVDTFGFGTAKYSPEMYDVLTIPHYALPDGKLGVCRRTRTVDGAEVRYIIMNFPLLVEQMKREDLFTWVGKQSRGYFQHHPEMSFIEHVRALWTAQYPLLVRKSAADFDVDRIWPNVDPSTVFAVPVSTFEHYRQVARKMEAVRKKNKKKMLPKRRSPSFKGIVQLMLGPIMEAGGAVFAVRAVFREGEVYFSPAWEADFDDAFFAPRNYVDAGDKLHDGTIRNEATGEYYYTISRYAKFEGTPVSQYTELKVQLKNYFDGMTKHQFQYMHRSLKMSPAREGFVPYGAQSRKFGKIKFFSVQEDHIITHYLRPGNITAVVADIQEIDPLKTRADIIYRAHQLREILIGDGQYELNSLPHVNYSSILGKRLSDLKTRKEREESEKAQQTSQSDDL